MKRKLRYQLLILFLLATGSSARAQVTPKSQMEKLNRGLVVVPTTASGVSSCAASWRLLGTDPDNVVFDLLKNGEVLHENINRTTFKTLTGVTATDRFQVVAKSGGKELDRSEEVSPWGTFYMTLKLDRPASGTNASGDYSYTPNDCSVGDVDGDGEYELFVKWDPSNSKDNSQSGYTGNVYIDCYKLNGKKLWRVDLGQNIRAGAHYTQYMVYDFDGDGKAELMCKTAPGSKDGTGAYVNQASDVTTIKNASNTADYRASSGHILSGPEYLTAFDGETGKAIHTVFYNPNRAGTLGGSPAYPEKSFWGDNYGNRSERYLACVAYLDGPDALPSAIFARGYYTRAYLWAVQLKDGKITTKWLHSSTTNKSVSVKDENGKTTTKTYSKNTGNGPDGYTCYGEGCHSMGVGDVDGDGCDEIMFGGAAVNNDGSLLYSTGFGHGDAHHLSDLDPDRPGLEYFQPHEHNPYGFHLRDARTGEVLYSETSAKDNGRGIAADIDKNHRGFEFWSTANNNLHAIDGSVIATSNRPSINFRIYWDGDLYDELLDGGAITKWDGTKSSNVLLPGSKNVYDVNYSSTCNGTKSTPNLTCDLFGDWREEIIEWSTNDNCTLNIFTSTMNTNFRVPTLMHDHIYRMSICWQNTAYNQPPHLGYYLPDAFKTKFVYENGNQEQTISLGESITPVLVTYKNTSSASVIYLFQNEKRVKTGGLDKGFEFAIDRDNNQFTISGTPTEEGQYKIVMRCTSTATYDGQGFSDTIRVNVNPPATGVVELARQGGWVDMDGDFSKTLKLHFCVREMQTADVQLFDMGGRLVYSESFGVDGEMSVGISGMNDLPSGIYMLSVRGKEGTWTKKVRRY